MELVCVGDVVIGHQGAKLLHWRFPGSKPRGDDARILFNWEAPIGEQANPVPRSSGPRILADRAGLPLIAGWAPGFAALANNHVLDAGADGLRETSEALQQLGFAPFGAGFSRDEIQTPMIWDGPEGRLGILNWVFPETHPEWMTVPGPNCWPGIEKASSAVCALKQQVDWVLVVPHWSDESFSYPSPADRAVARGLIAAGADLIVGHHPHVVRGWEAIEGRPVFYSLGNFFFSEIRGPDGQFITRATPRNREALVLSVVLRRRGSPRITPHAFWQNVSETIPDPHQRAVRRLKRTSRVLAEQTGAEYVGWYEARRRRFNRLEYRLYFSLWYKGWRGALHYPFELLARRRARHTSDL